LSQRLCFTFRCSDKHVVFIFQKYTVVKPYREMVFKSSIRRNVFTLVGIHVAAPLKFSVERQLVYVLLAFFCSVFPLGMVTFPSRCRLVLKLFHIVSDECRDKHMWCFLVQWDLDSPFGGFIRG